MPTSEGSAPHLGESVIQDVDESIRKLILGELQAAGSTLIKSEDQVVLGLPTEEQGKDKKARVNLYLHDVRENLKLRDETFHLKRGGDDSWTVGKRHAPIRLDLSYLITVTAEDSLTEHRLLGEVLAALIRNNMANEKYLAPSLLEEQPGALLLSVAQPDHPAHNDQPKLWQSLGTQLRPTLGLVATAKFNPFETKFVRVVREAIFGMGQGIHPEGPDRQMDLRSVRLSACGLVVDKGRDEAIKDAMVSIVGRDEQTTTDERGFFNFNNLPPNRYTLRFRKRGFKTIEMETVAPPPGRGDALQPMDVAMTPLDDAEKEQEAKSTSLELQRAGLLLDSGRRVTVSVVGTLRLPNGDPAPYVPVRIGGRTAVTDEDGGYHFTGLAPGEHEIIAEIPGRGEVPVVTKNGTALIAEGEGNGKKAVAKR